MAVFVCAADESADDQNFFYGGFAAPVSAQQASLVGTVLDDVTERPIAEAEVAIAALNRVVRSDSAGNFAIVAIPAGTYRVTVRAPGRVGLYDFRHHDWRSERARFIEQADGDG